MCSHSWNKLITISFALAAGGVLACAGALLDVFIPSGSLVGFLARMLVLGFAITGVVIGFTWGCDKCESYFSGRLDRLLGRGKLDRNNAENPGTAVGQQLPEPKVSGEARPTHSASQPLSRDRYILTLRGSASPKDATMMTTAHKWHGQ